MKETSNSCSPGEPTDRGVRLSQGAVWRSERSDTVQIRFPDGGVYEGPIGTTLEEFVLAGLPNAPAPIVAARVNGKLKELTNAIEKDADVIPLSISSSDGMRIYRRSLCFLLITAVNELFPGTRIVVDHSLTVGGLFCHVLEHESFTNLLWATFHLTEELEARPSMDGLPDSDLEHIAGDIKRLYGHLATDWVSYVEHLKSAYPFLFSLVVRIHPFQENPSPVVS